MRMQPTDLQRQYWLKNRCAIALLLLVWFVATFGVSFFSRALSFDFFGWPFSFWMGAQGTLGVYLAIVGFYAWYMNRLDKAHGVDEEHDPDQDLEPAFEQKQEAAQQPRPWPQAQRVPQLQPEKAAHTQRGRG